MINVLKISIHNILTMIKNGKTVFFIAFIGLAMITYGILFYSGYMFESLNNESNGKNVALTLQEKTLTNDIEIILDKFDTLSDNMVTKTVVCNKDDVVNSESYYESDEVNTYIQGEYDANYKSYLRYGKYFEYDEKKPYMVIQELYADDFGFTKNPVGTNYKYNGKEFEVIGLISSTDDAECAIVPINYYINNFETSTVKITYKNIISYNDKTTLENFLNNCSSVKEYEFTSPFESFCTPEFFGKYFQIFLIFILSLVNIFAMIYFLIKRSQKNYNIYAICGGSEKKIFLIILLQSVILSFSASLIGLAIYYSTVSLLSNYGLAYTDSISIYMAIFIFVLLVMFLFAVIVANKSVKEKKIYIVKE